MDYPSLEELLDNGVHFGHRSSRWNPKMSKYIFTTRNKIHVINLESTLERMKKAADYIQDVVQRGNKVLFVGTKRQAKNVVKKAAQDCNMPYVTVRWLGGTFTNFKTIQKTIKKLKNLQQLAASDDFDVKYVKKERLIIEREIEKLQNLFEGIKDMKELPEAIFVIDVTHEKIAIREAQKSGVKVIGVVDTNSDPEGIDYPVPANDDAIKSITLLANFISDAVKSASSVTGVKRDSEKKQDLKNEEKGDK